MVLVTFKPEDPTKALSKPNQPSSISIPLLAIWDCKPLCTALIYKELGFLDRSCEKVVYHPKYTNAPKKYIDTPVIYVTGLYTMDVAKRQPAYKDIRKLSEHEFMQGLEVWVNWLKKGVIEWEEHRKNIWDAHLVADFICTTDEYRSALSRALKLVLEKKRPI